MNVLTRIGYGIALVPVISAIACTAVQAQDPVVARAPSSQNSAEAMPTPTANFERLKSLAGEWIDVTGSSAGKGNVAAIYRVTSGGSVVQETLFPGSAHEMVSMYTAEGNQVLMSHYCAMGNQPRMRAKTRTGDELVFVFDGGGVADPDKDMHMHNGLIRFESADKVYAEWQTWQNGAPGEHKAKFTLQRKPKAADA